jgi:hypothetical protein
MNNQIFQSSDLAKQRTEFLEAARTGRARVRDKDGTGLVMLPESELDVLEQYAQWSQAHVRLSSLLASKDRITVSDLGELAWLRVFDRDDLSEFADELRDALIAGLADKDLGPVFEMVDAWRTTAKQLEDPLRRSVLLGNLADADLVDADRPVEDE